MSDLQIHQAGEVARAAGIEPTVLQNWLNRGVILMSAGDREAAGAGRVRLFSFRRALQVAIAAELTRLGVPVSDAARHALEFTDIGGTAGGFRKDREDEPDPPSRPPGELFPEGKTFLIVYPGDRAEVVN